MWSAERIHHLIENLKFSGSHRHPELDDDLLLEALFESGHVGKIILTREGKVLPNKVFCKLLGYEQEKFDLEWNDLMVDDEKPKVLSLMNALFKGEMTMARYNRTYIHKDGKRIVVDESICRLGNTASGKSSILIATMTELPGQPATLAAKEQAEEEQKEKQKGGKFKAVFESANVGKIVTLPSGELQVNQALCDIFGYSYDELQGKRWQNVIGEREAHWVQRRLNPLFSK
jgi:PAS domain S-box-containing protein